MAIVDVRGLSRTFQVYTRHPGLLGAIRGLFSAESRDVHAVRDVSFAVEPGEFVGYVGPNGAGKSTTTKMVTGILAPTSGEVTVCGMVPHANRQALAKRIGVVFGQRTQLWWDLPPVESYTLLGRIYEVPDAERSRRVAELSAMLGMGADLLSTPVRKLSLGQRMRADLLAALLHEPDVLFLDEPTIGLDVVVKEQVRTFLRRLNRERGTTILLTSHDLDDIERLCSRIIVIDGGTILHDGDLDTLRRRYGHRRRLVVDRFGDAALDLPDGAEVVEVDGPRVTIVFDPDRVPAPALIGAVLAQQPIRDIAVHESAIEDVIRRIYAGGRAAER